MKVIMISGKSASGKDTLANIMKEKLERSGCKCLIIHFADLVKEYCKLYYNWDGKKDAAGRKLLQTLGTDKIRTQDENYWAECVGRFLAAISHYNDFDVAFIPDARFVNEIEVIKKYNPQAISIRINRVKQDGTKFLNPFFTKEQLAHPSETSLDDSSDFDYIIENKTGDMKLLYETAETILADTGLLK